MPDFDPQPPISHDDVRALLDAIPDPTLLLDDECRCCYANSAAESELRRDRETVLGQSIADVLRGVLTNDVVARLECAAREKRSEVFALAGPDGATRTVQVRTLARWTIVTLTEAAPSLARNALDERLESRLLHAQRLEVLGRIAGGVAHDFNNLLTVIRSYSQIVEEELPAGDAARIDINEVIQATNSAVHLTRQLLSFGCTRVLEMQRVDVNATVRRIVGMLRRVIGEDIRIDADLSSIACAVLADPCQLEQVLMNLAVNARDAMPDGGVLGLRTSVVVIDEAPTAIGARLRPGEYVSIVVQDTGVGISKESVERIFEAFYTTKEEGAGLGLAMVMSIVEKLGGDVRVESALGEGSRFTVLLPCLCEGSHGDADESDRTQKLVLPPPRGRESILIVEDELGVRAALRRMLERLGYAVSEAATGAEAVNIVSSLSTPPDLVLMDVIMPEQSGPVVADRLLSRWTMLRVLFISGYSADELRQRGIRVPAEALLEKPVTVEHLAHAVRHALNASGSVSA